MAEQIKITERKPGDKVKPPVHVLNKSNVPGMNSSYMDRVLHLQRTVGNREVTRLIRSGVIRAKLSIGRPGDIYEQEADRIADQVMRMPDEKQSLVRGHSSLVQRQSTCPGCEEEEKPISRKESGSCGGSDVMSCVESHINALKGRGQPLSPSSREFFEPRFGADFSQVRVHSGSDAAAIATEINAKAFTTGNNIFFNTGQYSPGTSSGKHLLSHELTHVLQQNNGRISTSLIQRACQYFAGHSAPDTYCQTRAEAEALVTTANPSSCFVYSDGPAGYRWRPIPGFGCAHYVAHQLGITEGADYANCKDGFSVTIGQITQGRTRRALSAAQVNDIWTNEGESHSGVVREVGSDARAGQVRIQACGTSGNIYTIWTSSGVVHQ